MNIKATHLIKNFSYTFISNILSMLISAIVVVIIPKLISVEDYGYWQLYLFYSAYVGFFHFGWNDGIYLRYGGKEYDELDKKLFFSQFYMLFAFQIIIASGIIVASYFIFSDTNRIYIFLMVAICLLILNIRFMLLFILQGTNRIKEYSLITAIDRILYCCLLFAFIIGGLRNYRLMIISDLIGKLLSLFLAMYYCRDIVFRKVSTFYFSFKEAIENTRVGIKLMFATIASMLIVGVVRFGIEHSWDVITFGKISLTLTVSNMMMLFINAVGIIMFPILRRTDEKKLAGIYVTMRDFLMVVMFGVLLLYFPIRSALSAWLPAYSDSLIYMALIFPMCVYEGKMALLINTYLKTLRQEKLMMKVNLISLALSIVVTFITTAIFKNLTAAIVSIGVLLAFRCILAELFLARIIKIPVLKDIILELIIAVAFVIFGWFATFWIAIIMYSVLYGLYVVIKRKDLMKTIVKIKLQLKAS